MYYLFKSIIFYIIKDPDVDKRRPGPQHWQTLYIL